MTRPVLPTPATPSYCAAMTVGTMVKRFAHVRFLVDCLWVQPLFTLSVPRDIFRTPALIWGRFIDSGNQVGRTRSDIQAAGPRRCQSQIVLLLLGCKAGLIGKIRTFHGKQTFPIAMFVLTGGYRKGNRCTYVANGKRDHGPYEQRLQNPCWLMIMGDYTIPVG